MKVLKTPRLILRKMETKDAPELFAYASDPEVSRYVSWETHRSLEDSLWFINFTLQRYATEGIGGFGIIYKETNQFIGTCGYEFWNKEHHSAEIGYALSRTYWGKGLMPEAIAKLLLFGFEEMGLNRIQARVELENTRSQRVVEKLGMRFEGVLREVMWVKGSYRDLKLYSILKREYAP